MTVKQSGVMGAGAPELTDVERGLVVGVLIGEGSFGGDGRYPQITLRMHVRHESLFRWLERLFPRSRLYGPTTTADGAISNGWHAGRPSPRKCSPSSSPC